MADLTLTRGDRKTLVISDLVDGNGDPTVFGASDVLQWTAKATLSQSTSEAFLKKTSADGGVTFQIGGDTGTVVITPADWTGLALTDDLDFVWDLQMLQGGDPQQAVTLTSGVGIVKADVTANPVPGASVGAAMSGVCTPWTTAEAVLGDPAATRQDGSLLDPTLVGEMIEVATGILFRATARLFAGVCHDTVLPNRRYYRAEYYGLTPLWWFQWAGGYHTCGYPPFRAGGCNPLSEITLGQYPIREITEVRIDGQVVDPAFYRIDDRRWLVRTDPSGIGWPCCTDQSLDPETDVGTFQVKFAYGQAPDAGGVRACKRLTIELAKGACGDPCALPERIQSLQLQGGSIALLDPMTFLEKGMTGIYEVDLWINSINPLHLQRRPTVFSPDIPKPVRRIATVPGS